MERKSDVRCGERGKGKITKNLETVVMSLYVTSILVTSPWPVHVSNTGMMNYSICFKKISVAVFG